MEELEDLHEVMLGSKMEVRNELKAKNYEQRIFRKYPVPELYIQTPNFAAALEERAVLHAKVYIIEKAINKDNFGERTHETYQRIKNKYGLSDLQTGHPGEWYNGRIGRSARSDVTIKDGNSK